MFIITFYSNFTSLQEVVNNENIVICEEMHNSYLSVRCDDKVFGVAYYCFGTKAQICFDEKHGLLFIGAGASFVCVSILLDKPLVKEELFSPFYEIVLVGEKLCVVCELEVFCFVAGVEAWRASFGEIISGFSNDNKTMFLEFFDGTKCDICIQDGGVSF